MPVFGTGVCDRQNPSAVDGPNCGGKGRGLHWRRRQNRRGDGSDRRRDRKGGLVSGWRSERCNICYRYIIKLIINMDITAVLVIISINRGCGCDRRDGRGRRSWGSAGGSRKDGLQRS